MKKENEQNEESKRERNSDWVSEWVSGWTNKRTYERTNANTYLQPSKNGIDFDSLIVGWFGIQSVLFTLLNDYILYPIILFSITFKAKQQQQHRWSLLSFIYLAFYFVSFFFNFILSQFHFFLISFLKFCTPWW